MVLKKKIGIVEMVAQQKGISTEEVRHEMEKAIEGARNLKAPETQANFKKLFGNKTPTPEEFIVKITKQVLEK